MGGYFQPEANGSSDRFLLLGTFAGCNGSVSCSVYVVRMSRCFLNRARSIRMASRILFVSAPKCQPRLPTAESTGTCYVRQGGRGSISPFLTAARVERYKLLNNPNSEPVSFPNEILADMCGAKFPDP